MSDLIDSNVDLFTYLIEGIRFGNGKFDVWTEPNTPTRAELNVANLQEAEVEIVEEVQRQVFPSEANAKYGSREVDKKKAVLKKMSTLRTLDPFLVGNSADKQSLQIRMACHQARFTFRDAVLDWPGFPDEEPEISWTLFLENTFRTVIVIVIIVVTM